MIGPTGVGVPSYESYELCIFTLNSSQSKTKGRFLSNSYLPRKSSASQILGYGNVRLTWSTYEESPEIFTKLIIFIPTQFTNTICFMRFSRVHNG